MTDQDKISLQSQIIEELMGALSEVVSRAKTVGHVGPHIWDAQKSLTKAQAKLKLIRGETE